MSKKSGSLRKNTNNPHLLLLLPTYKLLFFRKEGKLQKKDRYGVVLPPPNLDLDNFFGILSEAPNYKKHLPPKNTNFILTSPKETKQIFAEKRSSRSIKRRSFSPTRLRPSYLELPSRPWSLTAEAVFFTTPSSAKSSKASMYICYHIYIYLHCNFHIWYIYENTSQREFSDRCPIIQKLV